MKRRLPLSLVGAILAPAVLAAFVIGILAAGFIDLSHSDARAQSESAVKAEGSSAAVGGQSPFVAVAGRVIPTVVNISAEKTVAVGRGSVPQFGGPLEELFREFFRDMPFEQERNALGSGVVIDPRGYIVTNNHVVSGFDELAVRLSDGTELKGEKVEIVGRDPKTDLAVVKVDAGRSLSALEFGRSSDVEVGDWAIAVGNAFGLQSTVTVGVISAKGRTGIPLPEGPSYQDFIQTDASINPGNSGGPLVNIRGELIGINTAIRSPVGASVGVGFAVPSEMVETVTRQLIEHGKVTRGFLGIRPQALSEAIRKAKGLSGTKGVLVADVVENTPAENAGLKAGDVLVELDGRAIEGVEQFRRLVAEYAPGSSVVLKLIREGKSVTKKVTLAEFPEGEVAATEDRVDSESLLGLHVRALTEEEKEQIGVDSGVLVEAVERGSAADEAGIVSGDVIFEIGDTSVDGVASFNQAVRAVADGGATLFRLLRSGVKMFVAVEPK